jgi:hypothetical protein
MSTKLLYKIEHNVPIPDSNSDLAQLVSTMKVGDSFVCPRERRSAIVNCAHRLGVRILTRKANDTEMRVWRIHNDLEAVNPVKSRKAVIATP